MKYFITGITGFAGPHLAKLLLKEGHDVHGAVRTPNGRQHDLLDIMSSQELDNVRFHYLDLKHFYGVDRLLKHEKFDGVFHLAAQSHPPTSFLDPILTFEENVTATVNIITSLEKTDTKLMFCSTSEVYGNACKTQGELKIDTPLVPSNPYGASKAAMDIYLQERMRNGMIKGFITRAFSHTGPRRGFNFSISSDAVQIAKMKLGLQQKVLQIGNLDTQRVVIDVRDCVKAYYLLMQCPESDGQVFNVCGTDIHKMQYFTDLLIRSAGFVPEEITQKINPDFYRPIDIDIQTGDCSTLRNLTGWKPEIPIEVTMVDLLEYWLKKFRNSI